MNKSIYNIVELPKSILADTANVMRKIAEEIENGVYGEIKAGYFILENELGEIETFGSGASDYRYGFSLLMLAQLKHAGVER
jgi:hypothetical protein